MRPFEKSTAITTDQESKMPLKLSPLNDDRHGGAQAGAQEVSGGIMATQYPILAVRRLESLAEQELPPREKEFVRNAVADSIGGRIVPGIGLHTIGTVDQCDIRVTNEVDLDKPRNNIIAQANNRVAEAMELIPISTGNPQKDPVVNLIGDDGKEIALKHRVDLQAGDILVVGDPQRTNRGFNTILLHLCAVRGAHRVIELQVLPPSHIEQIRKAPPEARIAYANKLANILGQQMFQPVPERRTPPPPPPAAERLTTRSGLRPEALMQVERSVEGTTDGAITIPEFGGRGDYTPIKSLGARGAAFTMYNGVCFMIPDVTVHHTAPNEKVAQIHPSIPEGTPPKQRYEAAVRIDDGSVLFQRVPGGGDELLAIYHNGRLQFIPNDLTARVVRMSTTERVQFANDIAADIKEAKERGGAKLTQKMEAALRSWSGTIESSEGELLIAMRTNMVATDRLYTVGAQNGASNFVVSMSNGYRIPTLSRTHLGLIDTKKGLTVSNRSSAGGVRIATSSAATGFLTLKTTGNYALDAKVPGMDPAYDTVNAVRPGSIISLGSVDMMVYKDRSGIHQAVTIPAQHYEALIVDGVTDADRLLYLHQLVNHRSAPAELREVAREIEPLEGVQSVPTRENLQPSRQLKELMRVTERVTDRDFAPEQGHQKRAKVITFLGIGRSMPIHTNKYEQRKRGEYPLYTLDSPEFFSAWGGMNVKITSVAENDPNRPGLLFEREGDYFPNANVVTQFRTSEESRLSRYQNFTTEPGDLVIMPDRSMYISTYVQSGASRWPILVQVPTTIAAEVKGISPHERIALGEHLQGVYGSASANTTSHGTINV